MAEAAQHWRATASYGVEDLAQWLMAHPGQSLKIEYDKDGWSRSPDDHLFWRAILGKPIGSKAGWLHESLPGLIEAIVLDLP